MTQSNKHYDHNAWLAQQPSKAPLGRHLNGAEGVWEPVEGDSLIQLGQTALRPAEAFIEPIQLSARGQQADDAAGVAKGTLLRALPVIGLALPLAICIAGLAWLSGLVSAGFVAFVISVLGLWGGFSLLLYSYIARQDHVYSFYGVERLKVLWLARLKEQQQANDYALKRAALDAYIRRLEAQYDE